MNAPEPAAGGPLVEQETPWIPRENGPVFVTLTPAEYAAYRRVLAAARDYLTTCRQPDVRWADAMGAVARLICALDDCAVILP